MDQIHFKFFLLQNKINHLIHALITSCYIVFIFKKNCVKHNLVSMQHIEMTNKVSNLIILFSQCVCAAGRTQELLGKIMIFVLII